MKPVLAVDFDDVLAQWMPYFCRWHNDIYGTECKPSDITSFDLWKHLDCSQDDLRARHLKFREYYEQIDILPVQGATEAMTKLSKYFTLALVTARNENDRPLTEAWLKKNIPVPFEYFLYGNTRTEHYRSKGLLCRSINAVCLIDDHCSNIASVARESTVKKAVLFNHQGSYGWSHLTPAVAMALGPDAGKVVVVKDWSEAADEVLHLIEPAQSETSASAIASVVSTTPSTLG